MWNTILNWFGLGVKSLEQHLAPLTKIVENLRDHAIHAFDASHDHDVAAEDHRKLAEQRYADGLKASAAADNIAKLFVAPAVVPSVAKAA